MKNCISFFAKAGVLAITMSALLFSLSFAATSEPKTQFLELRLGGSEIMTIEKPSYKMKVITSDENVVDARPLKEDKIYIRGKKLGYCTITIWDERTKQITAVIDVTVTLDLTGLKQQLHELYPNQDIHVRGSEKGVVLSGTVSGPEVVEQVLRLTQNFLPKLATGAGAATQGTGRSGASITNLLKVGGIQQVMLEVKFAEVKRDSTKDWQAALGLTKLGRDFGGVAGIGGLGDLSDGGLGSATGSLLLNFANLDGTAAAANIFAKIDDVTTALRFLEGEGLSRLLAEPRLVTQSGQEASFLAGGEFPIPVQQGGTAAVAGGITVEFKEFGVGLIFTPVVLSDGKVSLRVAPSVTSIASTSTIPSGISGANFIVPSLSTRKLETTVQLYDGQTLALAGLLQDNIVEEVTKIPGLGDIPILGALFRSTSFQQEKTDLLVTVTPHLVKPDKEGAISYPGEYVQVPNRFEFYLEGRLEGRRSPYDPSAFGQHSFAEPILPVEMQGGLEGEFGQQPVTEEQ